MRFLLFLILIFASSLCWAQKDCECIVWEYFQERDLPYLEMGVKDYQLENFRTQYNWPIAPVDKPSPLGHVCHSYQNYGGQPYFHHGIDIRRAAHSDIFASTGGKVVNIENYVPGNDLYWEIAILDDNGFLWQYHHVDRKTIPQEIFRAEKTGTSIASGTLLGRIVYWPAQAYGMNFHHIHVNVLDGNGNYINPLRFLVAPFDLTPPRIKEIFFLRNEGSTTVSPQTLSGDIDIIVQAEDLMDKEPYQLTIYKLEYEVRSAQGKVHLPRTPLWQFDRLPKGNDIHEHVHTIYKSSFRDGGKRRRTSGNYRQREFYFVLTNQEAQQINPQGAWKTKSTNAKGKAVFPNGDYNITVYATDFNGNSSSKSVSVKVEN